MKALFGVTRITRDGDPDVQFDAIAAHITLDMIGRKASDSLTVDGLDDIKMATPLAWIATAHPELRLTLVDGGTIVDPREAHFPFVRIGAPGLYFHNARHTGQAPADSADAIDTELAARILRLAFYAGTEMANAADRPRWTSEGRRRYLQIRQQ
jgi:hypothetical protein